MRGPPRDRQAFHKKDGRKELL